MAEEAGHAASAVEAHGAGGGAEAHGAFPPFDASLFEHQLFWLVVSFGALYWLLSTIVLPKIGAALEARRAKIEGDLAAAAAAQEAARSELAAYEAALAEARQEARRLSEEVRAEAAAVAAKETAEAEAKLAARTAEAEARLAASRAETLAGARAAAEDAAHAIVAKLLPQPDEPRRMTAGGVA